MLENYLILCIAHLIIGLIGVLSNTKCSKQGKRTLTVAVIIATVLLPLALWGYIYYWWQGAKVDGR